MELIQIDKAEKFSQIIDATSYNNPIDNNNNFYTNFAGFRKDFNENKIYRLLNISKDNECNPLIQPRKIFLRGHRGTGKTSELLTLKNSIRNTECYFVVFVDLSSGELDINNIEIVDILILLLEKLVNALEDDGAVVPKKILEPFYRWYDERLREISTKVNDSLEIKTEAELSITIPFFSKLLANTTGKLASSNETKEVIRRVFTLKISEFLLKFNNFILSLKETFNENDKYKDLLFIVDGFEKIGSLENQKKVIIDDSTRFEAIRTNMIITLPIELFEYSHVLESFAKIIPFPLITLDENAKEKFTEFILKRLDVSLFENQETIGKIIEYGAGSPRETLRIIQEAFVEAENDIIDMQSVDLALESIGKSLVSYLEDDEVVILSKIFEKKDISFDTTYATLLAEKVLLEYGDDNPSINPILLINAKFQRLIKA